MPDKSSNTELSEDCKPIVSCSEADSRFRQLAAAMGLDPDSRWVGGYVDYEWCHVRWLLDGAYANLAGRRVLEFGCNLGATAIVLAALGAVVEGVDINENFVNLGRLNVARYGLADRIQLRHVPDTTKLDWPDGHFDAIVCNSVLEYIPRPVRPAVLVELDRLLRDGGLLFVLGTSNRLWPREVHSRKLFVNYLPQCLERIFCKGNKPPPRGVLPFEITRKLRRYKNLCFADHSRGYLAAKRKAGAGSAKLLLLRVLGLAARPIGMSAGLATPSINVVLQKSPEIAKDELADEQA